MAHRTTWLVASILSLCPAACSDTADPISLGQNDKDASSTEQKDTGGSSNAEAAGAPDAGKSEPRATGGSKGGDEPAGGRTTSEPTGGAPGHADAGRATGGAAGVPPELDAGRTDASSLGTGGSAGNAPQGGTTAEPDAGPRTGGAPNPGTGGSAGSEPQGGTTSRADAGAPGRGVEIYEVRGYETSGSDLSYQSFEPDAVELEATPVLEDSEILTYDLGSHVFDLTVTRDELKTRVGQIPMYGTPFVLAVDGARVLGGWFWVAISSVSCTRCITLEPDFPVDIAYESKIELEYGYPSTFERPSPDPRQDPRLIDRLREDGRLLDPLPLAYGLMETSSGTYAPGTAERGVVDRFLADRSPGGEPATGSYVFVELLPYAGLNQRPVDLVLADAGLSAFVTYLENGEMMYQPDHVWRIPLETIELDLLELATDLGVAAPRVLLGEATYLQDRAF
jgi:hypothetical protein